MSCVLWPATSRWGCVFHCMNPDYRKATGLNENESSVSRLTFKASWSCWATARAWGLSPSPRAARSASWAMSCSTCSHLPTSSCLYGPGSALASLRPSATNPRMAAWPGETQTNIWMHTKKQQHSVSYLLNNILHLHLVIWQILLYKVTYK